MPFYTAHPLWSRIRSATRNVAELTTATIEYANGIRDAVRAQRETDSVQAPTATLRFQHGSTFASASQAAMPDDDSVDSGASFTEHLNSGSKRLFRTPTLRPKQHAAVKRIVLDPSFGGKLLVVERTGDGKSLMFYMTAVSVGGIAVIIVPLLSLKANQLERIRTAVPDYDVISAYSMDDTSPTDIKDKIIPKMLQFDYNSLTTMVLLSLPQFIADNVEFRDALLRCRDNETLRMCAIDKVHMYAQHVNFRDSICILRRDLFSKLYGGDQSYEPLFFCATATQPQSLLDTFSDLTFVDW
eukprot:CAMPEP_0183722188 /NCGR_PEP_ID=MMETSP0737-20130205/14224_1 /TAXON_ID=385413 /ORGANISM="Thalassiosira miniscula, Strain CCMP1093" /LENGTH=298 /DNA_ID=CAMNT_0025952309 /DNA_START=62 /DNA_END=955 /DNA_ORIENTATION=+